MDNSSHRQVEMEINLREVIWDLLSQWKVVLATALAMAVLVAGAKYARDVNAYNASEKQAEADSKANLTAAERIEEIYAALPADERSTVEMIIKQDEWIEAEKDYINNSIRMRTNPTSQRTLDMTYYLETNDAENADVASLIFGYTSYVNKENMLKKLAQIIDSSASTKYIAELISVSSNAGDNHAAGNNESATFSVSVILPDEVDIELVEAAVNEEIGKCTEALGKEIAPHRIKLIRVTGSSIFSRDALDNRNNILYSINNLTNNSKNMQSNLSDGQMAAIEAIKAIKAEERAAESAENAKKTATDGSEQKAAAEEESVKPGFSKKYALLGFILGVMAYAFGYLLLIILRRRINYASDMENYTDSRQIGEVYYNSENTTLKKLLHSRLVDDYRYGSKADAKAQIKKAADSLEAVCKHAETKSVTMFNLIDGANENAKSIIKDIAKGDVKVNVVDVTEDFDEKSLLSVDNAIIAAGKETKVSVLGNLMNLCRDYDVRTLANIYIAEM